MIMNFSNKHKIIQNYGSTNKQKYSCCWSHEKLYLNEFFKNKDYIKFSRSQYIQKTMKTLQDMFSEDVFENGRRSQN